MRQVNGSKRRDVRQAVIVGAVPQADGGWDRLALNELAFVGGYLSIGVLGELPYPA
jgi:hypothetical protein